jgi:hypothetical protein
MVGPRERSLADGTFEGLGSGVFPVMARQLVRSGKPPLALGPVALVRLLSCKKEWYENVDRNNVFFSRRFSRLHSLKYISRRATKEKKVAKGPVFCWR